MNYLSSDKKTRELVSSLSEFNRDKIDQNIYLKQILEQAYPGNYREIELLILSVANYTHREISEALDITRDGVTRRIIIAREVLGEMINNDVSESNGI